MALLTAILVQCSCCCAYAQKNGAMGSAREYDLKAVYLYNFLRFTNWPDHTESSGSERFSIGVIGNSKIIAPLQVIAQKSNGKIQVGTVSASAPQSAFTPYDLLFISQSEENQLDKLLTSLSPLQVLTVSDIDTFCEAGGMIRLVNVDNRIRWEINLSQLKRSGISVKAQLLKSAWKVR